MTFIEKRSAYDTIGYVEVLPLYITLYAFLVLTVYKGWQNAICLI